MSVDDGDHLISYAVEEVWVNTELAVANTRLFDLTWHDSKIMGSFVTLSCSKAVLRSDPA